MDYRSILKIQLQRRQELNPKYSLRAFAKKLEISPSKISELLSGKKKLSIKRAENIANRLGLIGKERELFILSTQIESTAKSINKDELKSKMRKLAEEINGGKTKQRNAWYFGAVNALEAEGRNSNDFGSELGLAPLQIENAKRFGKRIRKFFPERQEIRLEPLSVLKKLQEECVAHTESNLQADFIFLTHEQVREIEKQIKNLILIFKSKNKKSPQSLCMVYWGILKLINKEKTNVD